MILTLAWASFLGWTTAAYADGPGDLDTTFNSTGIVTTSIGNQVDFAFSVAMQPDHKIVVAGVSRKLGGFDLAIVRYQNDGSLDTDFNSTGIVTTPLSLVDDFGYSVAIQPDGKIVVAGGVGENLGSNGNRNFAVVRYTSDGNLDTTFNSTGIVTTPIGTDQGGVGASIAIQSDGKIVVAGASATDSDADDFDFAVARYLGDPLNFTFLPVILKD
jgi:uncharacterized delta-60 repeat protein